MTMTMGVTFIQGFRPGYLGRIAQMHGEYYSKTWGLEGMDFEAMVAREVGEFAARYQLDRDLLLTAHADDVFVGSIAMDGSEGKQSARLRWYLLNEAYQGRGIGSDLLRRTLDFCRERGFQRIYLWTVEGLPESRHLYERVGFRVVERYPDARYSTELVNLRMELEL